MPVTFIASPIIRVDDIILVQDDGTPITQDDGNQIVVQDNT